MNALVQARLDRIEAALSALVDSIASYNPSIPAASSLFEADNELNVSLKRLAQHQRNHTRILHLQHTIDRQNEQIKDTIKTLASTRADLLSIPTSLPVADARNVPYTELLDYATRISRFTAPPNSRPPLPLPRASDAVPTTVINGDIGVVQRSEAAEGNDNAPATEGLAIADLQEQERQWLNPQALAQFVPWINELAMKGGALAEIQAMVERGEDPALVKASGVEEEKQDSVVDTARMDGVETKDTAAVNDVRGQQRQERPEEKPKVFGGLLDLYDPSSANEDD